MGQILTWIRGPRDGHALQDVSVEEQSQSNQATPKPAAQVSNVKPAQFEKPSSGSGMAAKPRLFTATSSEVTHGGVAAGGSASVGRAGKAKPETNTTPAGATVIDMSSAGATFVDMTSAGPSGGPKEMSKTAAVSQVKASTTVPSAAGAAVTKPKESPKSTAKSATATTTVKADVHKVDPAKTPKPVATLGSGYVSVSGKTEARPTQHSKVQVEIPPAAAKGVQEVDPFDALASILPSADAIAPRQPVYTGPEVTELNVTSEEGHMTGGGDCPLPPGYRFEDMPPAPADVKPQDVPKPMSTGEALDSLSDAFMTPAVAPQKPEKKVSVESVSASSAGPANFAPPPVKTGARPPADKKAKMEEASCDFSLASGLNTKPKTDGRTVCPPKEPGVVMAGRPQQAKTDAGDSMSLDALSALVDTLPEDKPKPKLPELRPEDIVSEEKHKKEKGVLVGERDDSIHPDYRFKEDQLKKLPAPKPEPTMATGDALDILSEGFMTSSAAPVVQAPLPKKAPAAVSPADKKAKMGKVSDDFSLEAGLDFPTVTKAEPSLAACMASAPGKNATTAQRPAAGKDATDGQQKTAQGDSMSLDALSALVDTLPEDKPKPKLPELRPEDIVSEEKHKKEKGVLVGERDESIHPDYRFKEDQLKKLPAPKPEPTMATGDALDILSEGFMTSSVAPVVQAPVVTPSAPPAQTKVEDLSAVDFLLDDFVAPAKVSGVQAAALAPAKKTPERTVCPLKEPGVVVTKPKTDAGDSMSLDALSALVDTLPEDKPKPKLPELRPEDIVSEEKHKKEKGVLVGERDDSIHPDYRFKEDQLKKLPAPKPEPTMATGDALDILSEGFMTSSAAPVVQAPVVTPSAPPAQSSGDFVLNAMAADFVSSSASTTLKSAVCAPTEAASELHAGPGSALDALSDTLKDIAPAPQPAPPPAKDLVKEKKAVEERLIKMGERDDSLPPEYRPTEEDLKAMAEAKAKAAAAPKEKKMDDKTALDLLSSDFSTDPAAAAAPAAAVATQLVPPVLDSEPLKPMAGPVLDSLSGTLLPDAPGFKSKADKPKKHHAEEPSASEQLPAPPSSDVVPKSTKKGGRS